jgi:hypothetical protein
MRTRCASALHFLAGPCDREGKKEKEKREKEKKREISYILALVPPLAPSVFEFWLSLGHVSFLIY